MGQEALNAFLGYSNLVQNEERFKELQRAQLKQEEIGQQRADAYGQYTAAQAENMRAERERQAMQDVYDRGKLITKETGDPRQGLAFINQNLGTDYEYKGAKDDWIMFGSESAGEHAWNWRTNENQTLVAPKPKPPMMRSYNQGGREITEFVDQNTGQVVRQVAAPRWKPESTATGPAKVGDLVKAYNSNLKGIASEVAVYLKPEQQRALEGLPEDSPLLAQLLAQSVAESGLSVEVKEQVIQQIKAVNAAYLPKINESVGVAMQQQAGKQGGNKGKVVRTGKTREGRKVIQYEDGTVEYAD